MDLDQCYKEGASDCFPLGCDLKCNYEDGKYVGYECKCPINMIVGLDL